VIGLPLIATWCEKDVLFGAERVYCHLFFGLADGSALAFFQFATPEDQALFGPQLPASPFRHIALARAKAERTIGTEPLACRGSHVQQYLSVTLQARPAANCIVPNLGG
jgi:hypothetical protein